MLLDTLIITIIIIVILSLVLNNFNNKKKKRIWNGKHSVIVGALDNINVDLSVKILNLGGNVTIICKDEITKTRIYNRINERIVDDIIKLSLEKRLIFITSPYTDEINLKKCLQNSWPIDDIVVDFLFIYCDVNDIESNVMEDKLENIWFNFHSRLFGPIILLKCIIPYMKRSLHDKKRIITILPISGCKYNAKYDISSIIECSLLSFSKSIRSTMSEYKIGVSEYIISSDHIKYLQPCNTHEYPDMLSNDISGDCIDMINGQKDSIIYDPIPDFTPLML